MGDLDWVCGDEFRGIVEVGLLVEKGFEGVVEGGHRNVKNGKKMIEIVFNSKN